MHLLRWDFLKDWKGLNAFIFPDEDALAPALSLRFFLARRPSVTLPPCNVAEHAANQNGNHRILSADLSRNGSRRATNRINDLLRHFACL